MERPHRDALKRESTGIRGRRCVVPLLRERLGRLLGDKQYIDNVQNTLLMDFGEAHGDSLRAGAHRRQECGLPLHICGRQYCSQ
jgi:hypothetical protein